MAYRREIPDASAIARNPAHLAEFIRDIHERVSKVEKRTATESVSTQQRAPVSDKPKLALFNVTGAAGKGRWHLTIRNPEFGNAAGRGKATPKPIYHRVSYSTDSTFRTGVTVLEPSPQTHFSIVEEPNQTLHFRIESSHDGVTWNLPQYKQAAG